MAIDISRQGDNLIINVGKYQLQYPWDIVCYKTIRNICFQVVAKNSTLYVNHYISYKEYDEFLNSGFEDGKKFINQALKEIFDYLTTENIVESNIKIILQSCEKKICQIWHQVYEQLVHSSISVKNKEEMFFKICKGITESIFNLIPLICDTIHINYMPGMDTNKARFIIRNIEKGNLYNENIVLSILEALQYDPFNLHTYELAKKYLIDCNNELDDLKSYFKTL